MVGGGEWSFKANPNCRADEELFVRMAQCSALFPMIQFSWAPWEALSAENARLCAEAAALHADMAAEILALVREAEQTGEPILRSLEYNDPHQGFAPITDEFMLGTLDGRERPRIRRPPDPHPARPAEHPALVPPRVTFIRPRIAFLNMYPR